MTHHSDRLGKWVLDVTSWSPDGPLAFCPIEPDGTIVTGLTFLGSTPPGPMFGVVHMEGQAAVEAWMATHEEVLANLSADLKEAGLWPTP